MLNLTLKPGEYLTIGEGVVVQYSGKTGENCRLMITAPKEVPVVRGTVLERGGEQRPDCIVERPRSGRQSIPWDGSKNAILSKIVELLDAMEKRDNRASRVKRLLHAIVPTAR